MSGRLIVQATLVIAAFNLLSRLLGFVREMVIARQFGATSATDAYLVALTIPTIVFAILSQALAAVVIPVFTEYRAKGETREAWRLTATVVNLLFLLLAVVTLAGVVVAPFVVKVIAPGLAPETSRLASQLTRIVFPMLVFSGLATLFSAFLNANKIFGIPAFSGALNNIVIIASAALLGGIFGIQGLAWGTVAGMALSALIQLPPLLRSGFRFSLSLDWSHPGVRKIVRLVVPVTLGISVTQAYFIIDRVLASLLPEGSISALNFAYKLIQLPVSLFVLAVSTAVFPMLTQWVAEGRISEVFDGVRRSLRVIVLMIVPASAGLMVLRTPIVQLLFERGAFDERATLMTAAAVLFYAVGLVGFATNILLTRAFYAFQDTKTPVKLLAVNIVANIVLSLLLMRPLLHGGLALAASLSAFLQTVLLVYCLDRRLPGLWHYSWLLFGAKVAVASAVLAFASYAVDQTLAASGLPAGTAGVALRVGAGIATGVVAYLMACCALGFEEIQMLRSSSRQLVGHLRRRSL